MLTSAPVYDCGKKTLDAEKYRCKERYFVAMTTPMST